MRTTLRTVTATLLMALAAACGGSGSTGLIEPAILEEVRRDGTCVTSGDTVTYCATDSPDAVGPGGATATGPFDDAGPTPRPTTTSGGVFTTTPAPSGQATASGAPASGTPTPGGGSIPTPTPTQTAAAAAPTSTPTPAPTRTLHFVVRGLPEGAECALAARTAESDDAWRIGAPVPAGGEEAAIDAPLPAGVSGRLEIALLCYETPPAALPADVAELADASPDVVFAPAAPVTVAGATRRRRVG